MTPYRDMDLFNIGSVNGLLSDGTKSLPKPILTFHQWGSEAISYAVLMIWPNKTDSISHIWNYCHISQGPSWPQCHEYSPSRLRSIMILGSPWELYPGIVTVFKITMLISKYILRVSLCTQLNRHTEIDFYSTLENRMIDIWFDVKNSNLASIWNKKDLQSDLYVRLGTISNRMFLVVLQLRRLFSTFCFICQNLGSAAT